MNTVVETALAYAAAGIPVFPWHVDSNGQKKPLVRGGHKVATTDQSQIQKWWTKYPDAWIGSPLPGRCVLDIDKHAGRDGELTLRYFGWSLSGAAMVETVSGGRHAHFKANGRTFKRLCGLNSPLPSIDLLADGGWCALPTPGSPYQFVNGVDLSTCAELPDEIAGRWTELSKQEREFRGDCDRLAVTAEGGRRTMLNGLAFKYALAVIAGKVREQHWRDWLTIAAMHCGLPTTEIDKTLTDAMHDAQEKAKPAPAVKTGPSLDFEEIDLWPDPVDGEALARDLCDAIRAYVVLGEARLIGIALWVAGTFFLEVSTHAPRLAITSPQMRCGKTTLLRTIGELVPRPVNGENMSPAVLFRLAELAQPVFLLDEVDQQLSPQAQHRSDLLSIINSGHERSGKVWRMSGEGAAMVPTAYRVFSFMALAGIGKIRSESLRDRCIAVPLERRLPEEKIERFDYERREHLHEIRAKLARFAADNMDAVARAAVVVMPSQLNDRQADNWRMAFRIAQVIGGDWPEKVRQAAIVLSTHADRDNDDDLKLILLADCRDIHAALDAKPDDWVKTSVLINHLHKIEEREWGDAQRPLTDRRLADLLRSFGIRSSAHDFSSRATGRDVKKGYPWQSFLEVWKRYL